MTYTNETVAVFGGASGIGEACVRLFTENNYRVLLGDNNARRGATIAKRYHSVDFVKVDIMDRDSWGKAINHMRDKYGHLNHYVHCPGGPVPGELEATTNPDLNGFLDMTPEDMVASVNFNLLPFMHISQEMAKFMIENSQDSQSITGIGSINDMGPYGLPAYSGSKGGMVSFAKEIANELGPEHRIKVNVVAPGSTETPLTRKEGMDFDAVDQSTMLRRHNMPEDVAAEVFYLATSKGITGQRRVVDNGQAGAADNSRYKK